MGEYNDGIYMIRPTRDLEPFEVTCNFDETEAVTIINKTHEKKESAGVIVHSSLVYIPMKPKIVRIHFPARSSRLLGTGMFHRSNQLRPDYGTNRGID